jgi:hypothetical protein
MGANQYVERSIKSLTFKLKNGWVIMQQIGKQQLCQRPCSLCAPPCPKPGTIAAGSQADLL